MAKVPVILKVGGFTEREVAYLTYSFNQTVDKEGQVTDIPRGGLIVMRMKALNNGNTELLRWMVDKQQVHDGKIEFSNTTDGKPMKTLFFERAYCVNYVEHWEDVIFDAPLAHWEEITISCKQMDINEASHINDWDGTGYQPIKDNDDNKS